MAIGPDNRITTTGLIDKKPMIPIPIKVDCQPTRSMKYPIEGAIIAVPIPPAAHKIPTPSPRRLRNQPPTAAMSGTIASDWVSDRSMPKKIKNCHTSLTWPKRFILNKYIRAAAINIIRVPYLSPSQPAIGEYIAPKR